MKTRQSGFTLVEIAIVLVIIGLLLGGILKGQELISSGKVKNLASDFRPILVAYNGYQDKFRAIPGDDVHAQTHVGTVVGGTNNATNGDGNNLIGAAWDSVTDTHDSVLFWQHVRLAGLMNGTATVSVAAGNTYLPQNAMGGRIGVSNTKPITDAEFRGNLFICTSSIPYKEAVELDRMLDDGNAQTGSVRAVVTASAPAAAGASVAYADGSSYTVCLAN